ncbi:DUF4349 domain-containing protein [Psychrobacillus sp.]|uniref:DUF4349 domain-containing protein n=1 Tax=Psychrobacillus sp. TaxID=1871623 RepID=UPI0028BF58C8|nr:DUF4349 domain-containing protein [Psychrobacillus sp.]
MKKVFCYLLLGSLFVLLAACSSDSEKAMEQKSEDSEQLSNEMAMEREEAPVEESVVSDGVTTTERMIIHQATIRANVKELSKAQSNIEQKVKKYGGYIVESNTFQEDEQTKSGQMTVRIPEKHFEAFLSDAEEGVSKILERNVTGQDVTEQYVDLSSRLKSKRAVEERLLEFMKNAEKTEDLLKISADLAKVQEEIEVMVGQIKYLENQTSFSTVELFMIESRVIVPKLDNEELNTWEKTKKQFVTSTNRLLATGSAIIVFFLGNLPVLLILAGVGYVVYWVVKRRMSEQKK